MKNLRRNNIVKLLRWSPAVLIVVGLIYLLVARPIQVRMEKARFEAVSEELQKVSDQIQTKIGKADQSKTVKSCGYASRDFGKGPRSCGTTIYLLYENKNAEESTKLAQAVIPLFGGKTYKLGEESSTFLPSNVYSSNPDRPINQTVRQSYSIDAKSRTCVVEYVFPVTNDSFSDFKVSVADNLEVVVGCHDDAMAEHYLVLQ